MKRNSGSSLQLKFVLLVLCSSFVFVLLLNVATRAIFDQQTRLAMQSTSRILVSTVGWAMTPLLEAGNLEDMRRLLDNFGNEESVLVARVVDAEGRVIARSAAEGEAPRIPDLDITKIFFRERLFVTAWSDQGYFTATPVNGQAFSVERNSDVAAVFIIGLRTATFRENFSRYIVLSNTVSTAALAVLAAIYLYFFRRWVVRPLEAFKMAATQLRDGDYAARAPSDSSTEFRDFAGVFNRMAQEVAWKESSLEARVAERTSELSNALDWLQKTKDVMVRQEKMASIGRLASGIAHEINNPAAYIFTNLAILGDYMTEIRHMAEACDALSLALKGGDGRQIAACAARLAEARRQADLDYILDDIDSIVRDSKKGTHRITEIVQGLKIFARGDEGTSGACDLNEILGTTLRILDSSLKYHCVIERDLGELPSVEGVRGKLEQVFINILSNAKDAMADEGTIRITSGAADGWARVSISDTGSGMRAETIEKIFEPFFTTKDVGKGTGLGLSISMGIVEEHGGRIEVESILGMGSTFTVVLPLRSPAKKMRSQT